LDLTWNDWASGIVTWGLEGTDQYVKNYEVYYQEDRSDEWHSASDRDGNRVSVISISDTDLFRNIKNRH